MKKEKLDIVQMCFENICKNYNIPAGLSISEPVEHYKVSDHCSIFIDIHAGSICNFYEKEVWMNLLKTGITSKKDYRTLRSLIRLRLIDALHGIQILTKESLHNLGAKK